MHHITLTATLVVRIFLPHRSSPYVISSFSKSDISDLRRDTPGCDTVTHFNNAGASLMPTPVINAVKNHIDLEATIGGYEAHHKAADQYQHTYNAISRLLNCQPHEVALVVNATRAWDMAFYSFNFRPGDKILTAVSEYVSNYLGFLQVARKTGVEIVVVPNDEFGQLSTTHLEDLIDDNVKLIAITHVPMNGGLVNPAEEIGQIARRYNIPYLLDACQSVGQMPIDVEQIGCDILSATGRKYLRGPRGTGFLYVSEKIVDQLEPPFIDLRAADWTSPDNYELAPSARRFETWENNVAGMIGLGVAVDYAMKIGLEKIGNRNTELADLLRDKLESIPTIQVHDLGRDKCGIVSFSSSSITAQSIRVGFRNRMINVSVAGPDSTLIDATNRSLPPVVRSSVHYYNTVEEIDLLCSCLNDLVNSHSSSPIA